MVRQSIRHNSLWPWVLPLIAGLGVALFSVSHVDAQSRTADPDPLWFTVDESGHGSINLYYFWTPTCPYCRLAAPFVQELTGDYPWLSVYSMDLTANPEHGARYQQIAAAAGHQAQYVPAFIFCGEMVVGFDARETTGQSILDALAACYAESVPPIPVASVSEPEADVPAPAESTAPAVTAQWRAAPVSERAPAAALPAADTTVHVPLIGAVQVQALSLPAMTLVLAGLDAFNPCAFFVLLFLLSMVVHAQSRVRMAVIGGVFVFFSGALYFVFMAAWLNVFLWLGELALITLAAGLLALVFGALNVKDYFYPGTGPSLSIPERAKPGLYARTRNLIRAGSWPAMLGSTALLAIAANSYELLCTAGFPMIFTRVLTMAELSTPTYYAYLLFYCLVYIAPLTFIVAVFTVRFNARRLREEEGRLLKLLSGLMMVFMGLVLAVAPAWLSRMEVAAGLLLAAGALTIVLHRSKLGGSNRLQPTA